MEKLKIKYPIIVEGKYDKIKLSSIVDGCIVATDGFGVFKSHEKLLIIKRLAEKNKIILLTDSDGAGKMIRSHITSAVPKEKLIQLYTPQIKGRERRKCTDSAEGYLGVEGIDIDLLYNLLKPFSDNDENCSAPRREITKADFYAAGLSGQENSTLRRELLAKALSLPRGMTANALLAAINVLCTYDEFSVLVKEKLNI